MRDHWEHFQYGAKIGVRGIAVSKGGAFEQAAFAMMAVIGEPIRVQPRASVQLACDGSDDGQLLVGWLNTLLRQMTLRRMLFCRFRVLVDGSHLHAVATGEPFCPARHRPVVQVKSVSRSALRVTRRADGTWTAQTVVDV